MPSPATSSARVFEQAERRQPVRRSRASARESARESSSRTTFTIRPQPRSRIPGQHRLDQHARRQHQRAKGRLPLLERVVERAPAGRPARVERPGSRSARAHRRPRPAARRSRSRSAVSAGKTRTSPPISSAAARSASSERLEIATRAPSRASALAMPFPMPWLAAITRAVRPSMPRSTADLRAVVASHAHQAANAATAIATPSQWTPASTARALGIPARTAPSSTPRTGQVKRPGRDRRAGQPGGRPGQPAPVVEEGVRKREGQHRGRRRRPATHLRGGRPPEDRAVHLARSASRR